MFERFTKEARAVVVRAQAIAREYGHPQVGSDHLLLALYDNHPATAAQVLRTALPDAADLRARVVELHRPTTGLLTESDADALRSVGIDLEAVMARIEESFGPAALEPRALRSRRQHVRFGTNAKQVLEQSLREALRLRSREIGSAHILLGLVGDADSPACLILTAVGVSPATLRTATENALRLAA